MVHMFFGGNTPEGFVSYYENALPQGNRLFLLKGGSGVGKHTLMKKVGQQLEKLGYVVWQLHCSNDPDSLDGVIIPKLQCGILDATAPHRMDPKLPACFDEIVDLGVYLDAEALEKEKQQILDIGSRKKARYQRAYRYLRMAQIVHEDTMAIMNGCLDERQEKGLQKSIAKEILTWGDGAGNKITHLFASAYTSKGYVDYIPSLVAGTKVIGMKGNSFLNKRMMHWLYTQAVQDGYDVTVCHSPIMPDKIDHLLLDGVSIISIDELNKFSEVDDLYDIAYLVQLNGEQQKEIEDNNLWFDQLVEKSMALMHRCLADHEMLESLYIPHMDFHGADQACNRILNKILQYAK